MVSVEWRGQTVDLDDSYSTYVNAPESNGFSTGFTAEIYDHTITPESETFCLYLRCELYLDGLSAEAETRMHEYALKHGVVPNVDEGVYFMTAPKTKPSNVPQLLEDFENTIS